jgi:hypothetical protein
MRMPVTPFQLFQITGNECRALPAFRPEFERQLQSLVEHHLTTLLKATFLASEYSTGSEHGGRIDTLSLDEYGAPLIIEYKVDEDRSVINQGLFYLDWLVKHQAEFQLLVQQVCGFEAAQKIDWSGARVLLIAESYAKYDLEAVAHLDANIDLVTYSCFAGGLLSLDTVASKRRPSYLINRKPATPKRPVVSVADSLARAPEEKRRLFDKFVRGLEEIASDLLVADKGSYFEFGQLSPLGQISMTTTQYPKLLLELFCSVGELEDPKLNLRSTRKGCQCRLTDDLACEQALELVRSLYARAERL